MLGVICCSAVFMEPQSFLGSVCSLEKENKVEEKNTDCEQKGKCKCDLFKIVVVVLAGKVLTI